MTSNFMHLLYSTKVMLTFLTSYDIWATEGQCPIHISIEGRIFEISENLL
jgi:hypothetical protein